MSDLERGDLDGRYAVFCSVFSALVRSFLSHTYCIRLLARCSSACFVISLLLFSACLSVCLSTLSPHPPHIRTYTTLHSYPYHPHPIHVTSLISITLIPLAFFFFTHTRWTPIPRIHTPRNRNIASPHNRHNPAYIYTWFLCLDLFPPSVACFARACTVNILAWFRFRFFRISLLRLLCCCNFISELT